MTQTREGGFLFTQISHQASKTFSKMLEDYGITLKPGEGRVLFAIWKDDGISFSEVVKKTRLPKSTLAETLDRLENAGYINRIPSVNDRRKVILRITDKAKGFQKTLAKVSEEMNKLFYQGFGSEEIDVFEGHLRRILENLS